MALNSTSKHGPRRLHLLIRILGLTGLLAAGAGAVIAGVENVHVKLGWPPIALGGDSVVGTVGEFLVLSGGVIALLALFNELVTGFFFGSARRSGAGMNAVLQVGLIVAVLFLVNFYSSGHYLRWDWTRDHRFTLPEQTQVQLRQLKGETTIVVYRLHRAFGSFETKEDNYDDAAERKIVEKINDLVEQLREFGPQFKVVVLDVRAEDYEDRVRELAKDAPDLPAEFDHVNENTVFFYVKDDPKSDHGKIQKLSFNALYQLDKVASRGDAQTQRNLVLRHDDHGIPAFTRRILNIDARKPRVAMITIHGLLSTKQDRPWLGGMGLGKTLADNGFEVLDIIIKKPGMRGLDPTVQTYQESNYEHLDKRLSSLAAVHEDREKEIKDKQEQRKRLKDGDQAALYRVLADRQVYVLRTRGFLADPADVERSIEKQAKDWDEQKKKAAQDAAIDFLDLMEQDLKEGKDAVEIQVNKTWKERNSYDVESVTELKRTRDLKAKLDRLLADCDLIIVPRLTIITLDPPDGVPSALHEMNRQQTEAIKKYLLDGKPMLACIGPPFARQGIDSSPHIPGDDLEDLLSDVGVRLGKQIVLNRAEAEMLGEDSEVSFMPHASTPVPPAQVEWNAPRRSRNLNDKFLAADSDLQSKPPNLIRQSLLMAARSVVGPGKEDVNEALKLEVRAARPIFVDHRVRDQLAFDPDILHSDPRSWNEVQPAPWSGEAPRPPREDESPGTFDKKGNGPFALAVAIESDLSKWRQGAGSGSAAANASPIPSKTRMVVLGHGGLFTGEKLSGGKEKLLIDSCNWLVGRDDLLSKDKEQAGVWKYPRVTRWNERELQYWHLGTQFLLPLTFAFLGCVVVLVRRLH